MTIEAIKLENLNMSLYDKAHSEGMSLSSYLELANSGEEKGSLDAFEALMKEANIISQSIPAKNIEASAVESFYRTNENKALFPEFIARTLVEAMTEFPVYQHLVAGRTPVDSNVYKASYLDLGDSDNKSNLEMRRVTEAAELPRATLKLGASAINLYKYGRAVEASYESTRRMSIEMFRRHINRIGVEAANNKVDEILHVIKEGDGNDNAAKVIKSTTLDAKATGGKLTRDAWIKFLLKFYPYKCTTVVADENGLLEILNVIYPESQVAGKMDELLSQGLNVKTDLGNDLFANVTLLYNPNIEQIGKKTAIYGLDKNNCVEEIVEVGSSIQEAGKFIERQTDILTISENSGFRKIIKDSAKILTLE